MDHQIWTAIFAISDSLGARGEEGEIEKDRDARANLPGAERQTLPSRKMPRICLVDTIQLEFGDFLKKK